MTKITAGPAHPQLGGSPVPSGGCGRSLSAQAAMSQLRLYGAKVPPEFTYKQLNLLEERGLMDWHIFRWLNIVMETLVSSCRDCLIRDAEVCD